MTVGVNSKDWALHLGSWGWSLFAISIGATLLLQDDSRITSPAWAVAVSFGGVAFWAWWMISGGVLMLISLLIPRAAALMIIGGVVVSFAFWARCGYGIAAAHLPNASLIGPQMFGVFAVVYLVQAVMNLRAFR